jgi:hypothetical protein
MTAVGLLTIGVVFTIGVITGIVFLVSWASRREDRRARLTREAPDSVTRAGRLLTNLYVRRPSDGEPQHYHRRGDDSPPKFSGPRSGSTLM